MKAWARKQTGFTIVELLIVIVVIAILAGLVVVGYIGITSRARATEVSSGLRQAQKQLELYKVDNSGYPLTGNLSAAGITNGAISYQYTSADGTSYCLTGTEGSTAYNTSNTTSPASGVCAGHTAPGGGGGGGGTFAGITIGSQTWATSNLNVGSMIAGTATPSDNGTVEKYCYGDSEANCTSYGALYTWDEAMQYSTTAGAQGICPSGSHISTDDEWKTLEMSLGMTQAQANSNGWRGTDQGTQLKTGGTSGMNIPLAGYHSTAGSYAELGAYAYVWSSSESGSSAWRRGFFSGSATAIRYSSVKAYGFSVRCLGN
jgi:uncharacterized protein (TIGR02145 family)/prepilin-type N-terminal cleavage/methylation domain-containing protein